mmetsp:Transcript_49792/g.128104  ORF Transcript_49792/g.128104 Transcript_49792/m.128104 type:complete len:94 (-) Transcript_49792:778-1059(-)
MQGWWQRQNSGNKREKWRWWRGSIKNRTSIARKTQKLRVVGTPKRQRYTRAHQKEEESGVCVCLCVCCGWGVGGESADAIIVVFQLGGYCLDG